MVGGYVTFEVKYDTVADAVAAATTGAGKSDRFGLFNKILDAWKTGKPIFFSTAIKSSAAGTPNTSVWPILPTMFLGSDGVVTSFDFLAPCYDADEFPGIGLYTFRNNGTYAIEKI